MQGINATIAFTIITLFSPSNDIYVLMCTLQCTHAHTLNTKSAALMVTIFYSVFQSLTPHLLSLSVFLCVCVLFWRVVPVCTVERQAQSGRANMPLKLRLGLNSGTERETGVGTLSMGVCMYSVCVYVHIRVCQSAFSALSRGTLNVFFPSTEETFLWGIARRNMDGWVIILFCSCHQIIFYTNNSQVSPF